LLRNGEFANGINVISKQRLLQELWVEETDFNLLTEEKEVCWCQAKTT
jgi:hypothetical protein